MFRQRKTYANQPSRPWARFITRPDGTRVRNVAYQGPSQSHHSSINVTLPGGINPNDVMTDEELEYESLLTRARMMPSGPGHLMDQFTTQLEIGEYLATHDDISDDDTLAVIYQENARHFDNMTINDLQLDRDKVAEAFTQPSFITSSAASLANTLLRSRDPATRFLGRVLGLFTANFLVTRDKIQAEGAINENTISPEDLQGLIIHSRIVRKKLAGVDTSTLSDKEERDLKNTKKFVADMDGIIDAEIVDETFNE